MKFLLLTILTFFLCVNSEARPGRVLGEQSFFDGRLKLSVDSTGLITILDSQRANETLFKFELPAGQKMDWHPRVVKPFQEFRIRLRRLGTLEDNRGLHFATFDLLDAKKNWHSYTVYGSFRATGGKWVVWGDQIPGFPGRALTDVLWTAVGDYIRDAVWTEYQDIQIPGEPLNNDLVIFQSFTNQVPLFSVFDTRELKFLYSSPAPSRNDRVSCENVPNWTFYNNVIQVVDHNNTSTWYCDTGWTVRLDLKNGKFIEEKRWEVMHRK